MEAARTHGLAYHANTCEYLRRMNRSADFTRSLDKQGAEFVWHAGWSGERSAHGPSSQCKGPRSKLFGLCGRERHLDRTACGRLEEAGLREEKDVCEPPRGKSGKGLKGEGGGGGGVNEENFAELGRLLRERLL